MYLQTDKSYDHELGLEIIDALPSKNLMITSGKDNLIKVWTNKKELVREIKFSDKVISTLFLNERGDLIVAHSGKISIIYI